ncbi:MAG TPA: uracil-DNA glycosylase [Actinomycetota bacterium]|nr:uracil-DNA glycosylase [Actinomycetota bacterium]
MSAVRARWIRVLPASLTAVALSAFALIAIGRRRRSWERSERLIPPPSEPRSYESPSAERAMGADRIPLEEAAAAAAECRNCPLWEGTLVYGAGNADADLMLIGGTPSEEELVAFGGEADAFLDAMLHEIGVRREDVYLTTIVKHPVPGGRDPHADEIRPCIHWLEEQVQLVEPKLLVPLGTVATRALLGGKVKMGHVHGERSAWKGRTVIPTFHPEWLRRGGPDSQRMRDFRHDVAGIRRVLDLPQIHAA